MTIPTPAALATKPCAIKVTVDTRCGAVKVNGPRTYTCTRHGEHDRHIDAAHNVAWPATAMDWGAMECGEESIDGALTCVQPMGHEGPHMAADA